MTHEVSAILQIKFTWKKAQVTRNLSHEFNLSIHYSPLHEACLENNK